MTTENVSEKIKLQLSDDYYVEITKYMGSHGEYYNVNGTNYDIHFPIDWVFQPPMTDDMTERTALCFGPEECNLCAEYGFYNGVFIGYCLHCANNVDFKRGNGLIRYGVEITQEEATKLSIPLEYNDANSIWNVYMQTVTLDEIGDVELAKKHEECFKVKKQVDGIEIRENFDFYKWLNTCNPNHMYISEEEDEDVPDLISVSSSESEPNHLSLVLPEPESEDVGLQPPKMR